MASKTDDNFGHISAANHNESTVERPLLRSFPNPSRYGTHAPSAKHKDEPATTKFKQYMTADLDTRWADLILILCFFISGLIDAGAYNAYENFASMQTGNTVFAALGVSNLPVTASPLGWTKSVTSIVCYLIGAMASGSFHRRYGDRKRWVLIASFTLQTIFILISAVMVVRGDTSGSPPSEGGPSMYTIPKDPGFPWLDLVPLGLLSFQAAAKVIASRALEYNALPVVVLTTLYAQLAADPGLFSAGLFDNPVRNRRVGAVVFYFTGAVVGGVAASRSIGFSGGLFIAAFIQIGVIVAWLLWKEEPPKDDDEEDHD